MPESFQTPAFELWIRCVLALTGSTEHGL